MNRPKPKDCQIEPPYPEHDTVLWSFRDPELVCHKESERCRQDYPHRMDECGEFEGEK